MYIKPHEVELEVVYKILIGSVLPRPIAWVSSTNKSGINNLAPFSFFNVVSSRPPILVFSPGLKAVRNGEGQLETVAKDTLVNIKDRGEFVVNVVSRQLAEKMNQTSANYPPDVSEFEEAGLSATASHVVSVPRVGEALISMECKLQQVIEFGQHLGAGNLVIGEIVCFHLDESVYKDGYVDVAVLQPVGRLAGVEYCGINDKFEIPRPTF